MYLSRELSGLDSGPSSRLKALGDCFYTSRTNIQRRNQTSLTVHPVSLPDASSAIFLSRSRSSSRPLRECPSCSQLPNTSRAPPTTPPFCPPFFSSATFCCRSLLGAHGKLQLWNYGAPILTGQ